MLDGLRRSPHFLLRLIQIKAVCARRATLHSRNHRTATSPALVASNTIGLDFHGADVRLDYFLVIETMP